MRLTADGSQAVLVFESMGRVIGLATAWVGDCIERDGPIGRVTALVVAEGQRGRGVGARLLAHAEDWMRSRGAGTAIINVQHKRTDAHRFYASRNYSVTGLRFTKPLTQ
jgi:GNAT superfamily N-acetyltransferase